MFAEQDRIWRQLDRAHPTTVAGKIALASFWFAELTYIPLVKEKPGDYHHDIAIKGKRLLAETIRLAPVPDIDASW